MDNLDALLGSYEDTEYTHPLKAAIRNLRKERDDTEEALSETCTALAVEVDAREKAEAERDALGRAGDRLAHELTFKDHPEILKAWWDARGHENCTGCNDSTAIAEARKP